ncbi:MAG: hypothetical protein JW798_03770 [Prolixibacteraceae bacterium]|nr:hypothetical protein [Prolixibacteraceae bacterium]
MRRYNLLLLCILLALLSCNKEEDKLPDWSKVSAKMNEKSWSAVALAFFNNDETVPKISIMATVINKFGYSTEELYFDNIPLEIGCHKLSRWMPGLMDDTIYSSYATMMDDVLGDRFVVCEEEKNFIILTAIDTINMKFCGYFQVIFIRDVNDNVTDANLPDTIRFTEGKFCITKHDEKYLQN